MLQDQDLISIQEVRAKVDEAYAAWTRYRSISQSGADAIVEAMAAAARTNAQRLAERAVEETGYGNARDKFAKNMLAADLLPKRMRGMRTLGVLREIPGEKIVEIGVPMGVVAAILSTTNPTSTAIYKTLISLKAGNGIVLAPHPRARACTCETMAILAEAAVKAGAPEGLIQCVTHSTMEGTAELMRHRLTAVILSTGGAGIVRAAYSSGKPAYGVGPGNVPVLVDISANIPEAIAKIVEGKSFDYGTLCSSEQTLVAEKSLREPILAALKANRAHRCDIPQTAALARLLITKNFGIYPDCVGQSPEKIAKMAGFEVPKDTSILTVEVEGIGKEHPLSAEKLSPVLSLYFVADFAAALDGCEAVLRFAGLGHTCGIYATDDARIRTFALRMPAYRVIANAPTPTGSTGISTNLFPAMTLGCGAVAGNSTSDNVGPLHLINIKRLAYAVDATPMPAEIDPTNIDRAQIVSAVERFLAGRVGVRKETAPAPQPQPPQVEPVITDFVCEDDVRKAIAQSKKIFIGPKTIVTPSARDLAGPHDILILTKEMKSNP
jgi:acetaldehyde dehydrogenase (acetylating)